MTSRFDHLSLEHAETLLETYAVELRLRVPDDAKGSTQHFFSRHTKQKGHLFVATHSVTFDPTDPEVPLLRIPKRSMLAPPDADAAAAQPHLELRADTVLHRYYSHQPFESATAPTDDGFRLCVTPLHAPLSVLHGRCMALFDAPAEPPAEMAALAEFDLSSLVDPFERHLVKASVERVLPMLRVRAIFLCTEGHVYLQSHTAISTRIPSVQSWPIEGLRRITRRRRLQRDTALELGFRARGGGVKGVLAGDDSLLLNFATPASRDEAVRAIESAVETTCEGGRSSLPPPPASRLVEMRERWCHGLCSNFDYLVFLNDAAGRSFNDLSQYPVFPWVLSDYTSHALDLADAAAYRDLARPIGALAPERLAILRERFASMPPDSAFMYGTHYSAPAFVAYWLVRQAPELVLHLHAGRFDEADRLFFSIPESWRSVIQSTSDVKELIPEFYQPELHTGANSFLCNSRALQLGCRQSGEPIADVELPPWASSPHDFSTKLREALESEVASRTLAGWIDLIFGHTQRGESAVAADNVFCPQAYDGRINLEELDAAALRVHQQQVEEFGQVPEQLFTTPHPNRLPGAARGPLISEAELIEKIEALDGPQTHGAASIANPAAGLSSACASQLACDKADRLIERQVGSIAHAEDHETLLLVDGCELVVYCETRRCELRRFDAGLGELTCCLQLRGLDHLCVCSIHHGALLIFSVGAGRAVACISAHEGGVVGLSSSEDGSRLVSAGLDGSIKLWGISATGLVDSPLHAFRCGAGPLTSVHLSSSCHFAAAGCRDGSVLAVNVPLTRSAGGEPLRWELGHGAIRSVAIVEGARYVLACSSDGGVYAAALSDDGLSRWLWQVDDGPPQRVVQPADDGCAITAGAGGDVYIWCLRSLALRAKLRLRTPGTVSALTYYRAIPSEGDCEARKLVPCMLVGLDEGFCEVWRVPIES